ncbi:MAG: hypothetical protein NW226_21570 [Microscillaceae bacterium]|nr:hypothetical protein [Microscillaceae bacterium]
MERLLRLIEISNQQIERERSNGKGDQDLMIRQAKYRKQQYTQELLDLLRDFDLPLQLIQEF